MDAVFKRACFLITAKTHVYYRKAGVNADPVPRVTIHQGEYVTLDEGKATYGLFKDGVNTFPDAFLDEVLKEQEWVAAIIAEVSERKEGRQAEGEGKASDSRGPLRRKAQACPFHHAGDVQGQRASTGERGT